MNEQRVTYVSIASSSELNQQFEDAVSAAERAFGGVVSCSIAGAPSSSKVYDEVRSPIDRRSVLGSVERATADEARMAIGSALESFVAWRRRPWEQRVEVIRAAAEGISEERLQLAALMAWEVGKNRIEALAEVEESADLLRYYAGLMEARDGYRFAMERVKPNESTESVYRPYGVWGVISPFNFPLALAAGMIAGALLTGNTVVFKPSRLAPLCGARLAAILWQAGVPREVLHLLTGTGREVGAAILEDPRIAGMAFTGSSAVGMQILRSLATPWPRPVVVEMGGKNPTVVTAAADVAAAAGAVARAAFGFGGQKCSACSRVYVEDEIAAPFTEALLAETAALVVGNPLRREVFLGPLIDGEAIAKYERYVDGIGSAGGRLLAGGRVCDEGDLRHGCYVTPVVATLPDASHPYFHEEMFVPILLVERVRNLDQALRLCNAAPYGLTAGIFSRDGGEVARFLDEIECGVTYVNRKSGSTTGAWPGINPFGGWKASGGTGPAALGPHYLLKFLREQSRTVNDVAL